MEHGSRRRIGGGRGREGRPARGRHGAQDLCAPPPDAGSRASAARGWHAGRRAGAARPRRRESAGRRALTAARSGPAPRPSPARTCRRCSQGALPGYSSARPSCGRRARPRPTAAGPAGMTAAPARCPCWRAGSCAWRVHGGCMRGGEAARAASLGRGAGAAGNGRPVPCSGGGAADACPRAPGQQPLRCCNSPCCTTRVHSARPRSTAPHAQRDCAQRPGALPVDRRRCPPSSFPDFSPALGDNTAAERRKGRVPQCGSLHAGRQGGRRSCLHGCSWYTRLFYVV
jgi:hypothetical protein